MTDPASDSEATGEARTTSLSAFVDGSAFVSTASVANARIRSAVRGSTLYRWLTTEPEPDVVVIDLRETRTVGPVLALLDRIFDVVIPYWRASALKRGLDRLVALGDRAADTRLGAAVARVLEPPSPPANDEHDESGTIEE